jgi:nicotinamide mononucleotide transporter
MVKWLKNEFWNGYTTFEKIFFASLILLQVIMYFIAPESAIGIICGLAGVICVALTAKGKISSYFFNFLYMILYMPICWNKEFYLEFGEQVFYFIACIFGVFMWKKNMNKNTDGTEQVKAKKFKLWQWLVTTGVVVVSTFILGFFGAEVLGSNLPYLDAMTVALAVIAQLLMVWRYREQWACWILIDVSSLIMFAIVGQWSMVAMYIARTANAFYGWYNWTKFQKA